MVILPDILESDSGAFQQKLGQTQKVTNRIHIDVIEPAFADNQTLYPQNWPKIPPSLQIDVHLMVGNPQAWIQESKIAGATLAIGHLEKISQPVAFVKACHQAGVKTGLAVDLPTPIEQVDLSIWGQVDQILLMSIKAGFAGQAFDQQVLAKIAWLKERYPGEIAVDGGINIETAQLCKEAGATALTVNTFLWSDMETNWRQLVAL